MTLDLLDGLFSVYRFPPGAPFPEPPAGSGFFSATLTERELSVVAPDGAFPGAPSAEPGFRALMVRGPLDFSLTGVLASIARPLAEAGISIFAVSTYDTDFLFVKDAALGAATAALERAGFAVVSPARPPTGSRAR